MSDYYTQITQYTR